MLLLFVGILVAGRLAWNAGRWAFRQLDMNRCVDLGGCWDATHDRRSDSP